MKRDRVRTVWAGWGAYLKLGRERLVRQEAVAAVAAIVRLGGAGVNGDRKRKVAPGIRPDDF